MRREKDRAAGRDRQAELQCVVLYHVLFNLSPIKCLINNMFFGTVLTTFRNILVKSNQTKVISLKCIIHDQS